MAPAPAPVDRPLAAAGRLHCRSTQTGRHLSCTTSSARNYPEGRRRARLQSAWGKPTRVSLAAAVNRLWLSPKKPGRFTVGMAPSGIAHPRGQDHRQERPAAAGLHLGFAPRGCGPDLTPKQPLRPAAMGRENYLRFPPRHPLGVQTFLIYINASGAERSNRSGNQTSKAPRLCRPCICERLFAANALGLARGAIDALLHIASHEASSLWPVLPRRGAGASSTCPRDRPCRTVLCD
jgi:hypothetical protein